METYKLPSGANGATFSPEGVCLHLAAAPENRLTLRMGDLSTVLGRGDVLELCQLLANWLNNQHLKDSDT